MSHTLIGTILDARLQTWASDRGLHVVYRNQLFRPAAAQIYLRAFTLPAATNSLDLAGQHRVYQGVYQISIVGPAGSGPVAAGSLADELCSLYSLNGRYSRDGLTVQVVTPASQGVGTQDDTTFTVPVSFEYQAHTD